MIVTVDQSVKYQIRLAYDRLRYANDLEYRQLKNSRRAFNNRKKTKICHCCWGRFRPLAVD